MGLSAFTDDNNGLPLGQGYIQLSTSAGNALLFRDPASAAYYLANNGAQFAPPATGGSATGGYNTETSLGQS